MSYEVTVAPVTVLGPPFFPVRFEAPFDMPYAERPKAHLNVSPDEPLRSLLDRAMREFGVVGAEGESLVDGLAFTLLYTAGDEYGIVERRWLHLYDLVTVDEAGLAYWGQSFTEVPYEELARSARAGVLDGDPARIYLILNPPEGNGVLLTWALLLLALRTARDLLSLASDVEGSLAFMERLRQSRARADRGAQAVEENQRAWARRGARPDNFRDMLLRGDPWSSEDLAVCLGTTGDMAEAVLEGFGFAKAESGLWRLRGDAESTFLADVIEEAFLVPGVPAAEQRLRDRLSRYIETWRRPPLPGEQGEPPL